MTEAERELLLCVARLIAAEYPDKPFGSLEVSMLHFSIKAVELEDQQRG